MALRFRKSIRLAPGIRLNASMSGLGLSLGPRGSSVSVSSRGVYANVGIPGTGISYRERLDGGTRPAPRRNAVALPGAVRLTLQDDGAVVLTDETGAPLSARAQKIVVDQNSTAFRSWLVERCEHWNQGVDRLLNLHLETPAPHPPGRFEAEHFLEPRPARPTLRPIRFWERWLPGRVDQIEAGNSALDREFRTHLDDWESRRSRHEATQASLKSSWGRALTGDAEAMQGLLEVELGRIEWPRETLVSFDLAPDGKALSLDVDLPEIEDMPRQSAAPASRGLRVQVKDKTETQLRKEYSRHVHAVGFRLIGEVLHLLPSVREVTLAAYSQRPSPSTGVVEDQYLYSVKVDRDGWSRIDFTNLAVLELPAVFEQFELRRKMTKTGVFSAIIPLEKQGA